jgi:hypothetical protein
MSQLETALTRDVKMNLEKELIKLFDRSHFLRAKAEAAMRENDVIKMMNVMQEIRNLNG